MALEKTDNYVNDLMRFLDRSVVNFYATDTVRRRLEEEGFTALDPRESLTIEPGGRYYLLKMIPPSLPLWQVRMEPMPDSKSFPLIATHPDSELNQTAR